MICLSNINDSTQYSYSILKSVLKIWIISWQIITQIDTMIYRVLVSIFNTVFSLHSHFNWTSERLASLKLSIRFKKKMKWKIHCILRRKYTKAKNQFGSGQKAKIKNIFHGTRELFQESMARGDVLASNCAKWKALKLCVNKNSSCSQNSERINFNGEEGKTSLNRISFSGFFDMMMTNCYHSKSWFK